MTESRETLAPRDLRFLVPALSGWAVAAVGIWFKPGLIWILCLVGLAAVSGTLARGRADHPLAQVSVIAAVGALMVCSVALGALHRDQEGISSVESTEVSVTAKLRETYTPGARSLSVTILSVNGEYLKGGGVPGVLVGADPGERTPCGATLSVRGFLRAAPQHESERWSVIVRGPPHGVRSPGWFLSGADALRQGLIERSAGLSGDGGRLLPGLAIGDTSAVDRGLVQAMRDTSLSHLVAVSGANCAIVVGIVVAVIALCGGGAWSRLVGGAIALAGFVVLVTPEPSIVRASLMAVVVLIFVALGRPLKGIPVLGITVLVILSVNPWMALDFAFALSVLASGGILLLVGPLTDFLSPVMPSWLSVILAVPIAAQIACQPLLIILNPVIPLWAVVANALAAPAAPVATILGMLVCLLGPLLPSLADFLAALAWWPAAFVAFLGRFFSALPLVTLPWTPGIVGAMLMAGVAYGGVLFALWRAPRWPLMRTLSGAVASLSLLAVLVGHTAPRAFASLSIPRDWVVAQCDVGQGDATVVRTGSAVILIDTGKYPEKLATCLALLGISELDLAIISHFDSDHVGAWPEIVNRVDQVWLGPTLEPGHQEIALAFARAGADVVEVRQGNQLAVDDYHLRVVWPSPEGFSDPGNDSSVVVVLEGNPSCSACLSGLFLGDLGEEPQRILMGRESLGQRDFVKVSHHGSADQYEGLYTSLRAQVGLIGVGSDNRYGHPTESALGILRRAGTTAMRSDERGLVTLSVAENGGVSVWSQR